MIVGVNLISIDLARKTGVENVCYHTLKYIQFVNTDDTYIVFCTSRNKPYLPQLAPNVKVITIPTMNMPNRFVEQVISLKFIYKTNIDVLLCPGSNPIFLYNKRKSIIYINDTYAIKFKNNVTRINRMFQLFTIRYSLLRNHEIITISKNTKTDLESLGFKSSKVHVAYCGINENIIYAASENESRRHGEENNLPEKFILYVGTLQPIKNIKTIIKVLNEVRIVNASIELVIVGAPGWKYDELYELVGSLKLEKFIHFTGYVSDERLPIIYKSALALLLISYYEGFGLPLIEAMHLGTPVIGSKCGSIPEVIGNEQVLYEPDDFKGISQKVLQILEDKLLRENLIECGYQNSKKYSWLQAVQITHAVTGRIANL